MKKINIVAIFVFALGFLGLVNPGITLACSPVPRNFQEALNKSDLIFLGKVESINVGTEAIKIDNSSYEANTAIATFHVQKYWKGNPTELVTIKSSMIAGYSCSPIQPRAIGVDYLVYAMKDSNGKNVYSYYSDPIEVIYAGADLAGLGNGSNIQVEVKKPNPIVVPLVKTPVKEVMNVKASVKVDTQSKIENKQSTPVKTEVKQDQTVEVKQSFFKRIILWFTGWFK